MRFYGHFFSNPSIAAKNFLLPWLLAFAGIFATGVQAQTTVVILRHGEKPEAGLGQLNCKGLNRALALPPVLLQRFGTPAAIYAPNPAELKKDKGVPYAYIRPLATIEPTAIRVGLPVNLEGAMDNIRPLVDRLLGAASGNYLVAWEHHWAANLARSLISAAGADPSVVPDWADDDFDSLYVISLGPVQSAGGRSVRFDHQQQGLNGLPTTCP